MCKKIAMCLVFGLVFWMAATVQAQDGIVFVDMEKVFNEYDKTQMADSQLKKQAQEYTEERQSMIEEIEALEEQVKTLRQEATDEALSEEVREEKKKQYEDTMGELKKKEEKVQEFNQLRSKQLEDQGKRMRENIVGEINESIKEYAQKNGYKAVVDSSSKSVNAINTVMYVDSRSDVTDDIIDLLNKSE